MLKFSEPTRTQFSVVAVVALAVAVILALAQAFWSAAPFALVAGYMFMRAKSAPGHAEQ